MEFTILHTPHISKLDQDKCLLFGLPAVSIKKLQSVKNDAARMVSGAK